MQLLEYQIILGIIATTIGLIGYIPYFKDIIKKEIKPHAFSWLIWGILQSAVFFASTSRGGGAGAWAIGAPALLNMVIFVIALFKGEKEITNIDKASLVVALFGIALWVITTNPVWGVIILSGVDVVGYIPTIRKAYKRPHEEAISVYAFSAVAFGISLFALQAINVTTFLYPFSLAISNTVCVSIILIRREVLDKKPRKAKSKNLK